MDDAEQVSRLIGDIYDAAVEASLWPAVLAKIAGFVGGQSAGLGSMSSVSKTANAHFTFGCDPHYLQLQTGQYAGCDPTRMLFFLAPGQVASTTDLVPHEEHLETRFFREWMRPQGWVDSVNAVLEKSPTSFALLGVYRNESSGLVDGETRLRMRLVAPHVRRAVLIGRTIDLSQSEAATFADTMDGLAAGTFLVDENARIVHANQAGYALIAESRLLRAVGGRLGAVDAESDQMLRDIFAACEKGDTAIGVKGIAVSLRTNGSEPHVAHILPLTSGARRRAGRRYAATAAVFVQKAAITMPSPPEVIARAYRLTPTELRVLMAIVEVGGVPEVAEALGTAETTIKTHLGRLYEKTGVRRQADLVKLVAGFSSPLS